MQERLIEGLTRKSLCDGGVIVFTLSSVKREVVDTWVDACLEVMQAYHDRGENLNVLQDFSHPDFALTTYSLRRGEEVAEAYPELRGKTAIVLPQTVMQAQVEIFIRKKRVSAGYRERQGFISYDEALAWLKADL